MKKNAEKNVEWGKDVITGEIQVDWLTRPFNKQVEKYFRVNSKIREIIGENSPKS